jgi:hypothetical protein
MSGKWYDVLNGPAKGTNNPKAVIFLCVLISNSLS